MVCFKAIYVMIESQCHLLSVFALLPPMVLCILFVTTPCPLSSIVLWLVWYPCILRLGRSSSLRLYPVLSRCQGHLVTVLIAEVFIIAPSAFQCTSLMWVSALCVPFDSVDRPEVECL